MKTLIYKSIIFSVISLMLWSCKKDEVKSYAAAEGTGATVTASATTVMPEKATEMENVLTIDFTKPDFGFQAASRNILQVAVAGTNFSAPKEVSFDANVVSKTYTGLDFNVILLALNLPFDAASDIEVRIKSEVSDAVAPLYSNVIALSVKPYPLITRLYVPGDYQGWKPELADSLTSATGNGIHIGTIYFPAREGASFEFKITPQKNWNLDYGKGASDGILAERGGNLKVEGPGSYKITVDLNLMTYEIKQDSWAIIGSAAPGGWTPAADNDMVYNNTTSTWSATVAFVPGEFKFRYNDAWSSDYGGKDGVITAGGANIAIATAGNYKVVLDIPNKTYTVTKL
ncbi:MAG: SusF/SusE family outer membrane protein [Sphingobacteriales bacterium]|nr:MAG: SusF/SusE family outer membrane protein [Sphingobacteriales bacterium]